MGTDAPSRLSIKQIIDVALRGDLTDELAAQITDVAEQCEDLATVATKDAEALRGVLPEIQRRVKAQAEAKVLAEAAEKEAMMEEAA